MQTERLPLTNAGIRGYTPGWLIGALRVNNGTGNYWLISQMNLIVPPFTIAWFHKVPWQAQSIDVISVGVACPAGIVTDNIGLPIQDSSVIFYEFSPQLDNLEETDGYTYFNAAVQQGTYDYLGVFESAAPNTPLALTLSPVANDATIINYLRLSRINRSNNGLPGSTTLFTHISGMVTPTDLNITDNQVTIEFPDTIGPWSKETDFEIEPPQGLVAPLEGSTLFSPGLPNKGSASVVISIPACGAGVVSEITISWKYGSAFCIPVSFRTT